MMPQTLVVCVCLLLCGCSGNLVFGDDDQADDDDDQADDDDDQADDDDGPPPLPTIAAGGVHTCADLDGWECWGLNNAGQLDRPEVELITVAAGGQFSCGLDLDGFPVCWGSNQWGATDAPHVPLSAIVAGNWHACGLDLDGFPVCWGIELSGESWPPEGVGPFSELSAGVSHTCGRLVAGGIVCWGSNASGQCDVPR